jgi:hypothetical protein
MAQDFGTGRSYTPGNFALDIEGYSVAFLKKFSGLSMQGDVVSNDLGPDNVQKKHIANIKWTPGKATIGIGMGKAMYDWIKLSFDKAYVPKNGSFTAADFDYKAQARLDFENAIITSVTVPKLEGSSKEAAYFDVEFEPERVRWSKGGGEDIRGKLGPKQKAWLCSNFRFELGGLPCNRVATIESFTWKCSLTPDMIGIVREPTKHPAKVTVPDLKLAISYADHQPWADWAKKWFVDGHHLEGDELTGRVVFLGPDMNKELGHVDLMNVGLKSFSDEDNEANSEKIKRFHVELYVEQMRFILNEYDA